MSPGDKARARRLMPAGPLVPPSVPPRFPPGSPPVPRRQVSGSGTRVWVDLVSVCFLKKAGFRNRQYR